MQNFEVNGDSQFQLTEKADDSNRTKYKLRFKRSQPPSGEAASTLKMNSRQMEKAYSRGSTMNHNEPPEEHRSSEHPLMRSLKRYRIQRLTDLFVSKLKQTAVLQKMPAELDEEEHLNLSWLQRCLGDIEGIQTKSVWNNIVQITSSLTIVWLMVIYSLVWVFDELENSQVLIWSRSCTLVVLTVQIITNFFVKSFNDGKVINELDQIIMHYLQNGFRTDLLEIIFLVLDMHLQGSYVQWFRLRILLKVPIIFNQIERIKHMVCVNTQRQQQWDLMMVFITNFLFAHILSVLLNAMAYLDSNSNWWTSHNLDDQLWYVRYIYGYYWGTNIMLTVGFGDYCATNWAEALALVFIQMVSCITLAYNINCVGNLMTGLRARDLEKNKNLRTFARMYEQSNSQNRDLENRISNFIVKAFEMKKNFDLEGQEETLGLLPAKLKEEFVKGANIQILENLYFLDQLAMRTLKGIALRLQKKITHPEEIIIKKGDKSKLHILYSGTVNFFSYQNKRGRSDYATVQGLQPKFDTAKNCMVYRQISLKEFIRRQEQKHYVSSVTYCVMHTIEQEDFEEVVRMTKTDFEKYCALRDQDSFDEVIEGLECRICNTKRHSKFECPRIHFVPLREIICLKYKHRCDKGQPRRPYIREREPAGASYTYNIFRKSTTLRFNTENALDLNDFNTLSQTPIGNFSQLIEQKSLQAKQNAYDQVLPELDKHQIWRNYFPKHNVRYNGSPDS